jgi:hypothetical protein
MQTEDQLQAEFFKHVWNTYPKTRSLFFSVPNGGTRNPREAMKLKATGTTAGIPDLIFLWNGKAYGFELKTETGVLSPKQKEIHEIWAANGICVHIIRTLAEGIEIIEKIING